MPHLRLIGLVKRYGAQAAVNGVSLDVGRGECIALLGPSGCGKTTTLRLVAGFISPDSGRILVGDRAVERDPPHRRQIGMVFQNYALFPHLTAAGNVASATRAEREARVAEALAMVGLSALADRYPARMSGGQQQRVALARALVIRPELLLLDEPLSNLDAGLRVEMREEIARLRAKAGITTLFVTHDQGEALSMSDRVGVMAKGVMQQFATPEEIYHRPATGFVASFIGKPNRLPGTVAARAGKGGVLRLGDAIELPATFLDQPVGAKVDVVIRQEAIRLLNGRGEPGGLQGTVALRSFSGARVQYVVRLAGGVELVAETASHGPNAALAPDTPVMLAIDADSVFAMASDGAGA